MIYCVQRGRRAASPPPQPPGFDSLTLTARRLLSLLAEYKTSKEIAAELFISVRTVERHRLNIGTKLNLHGSNALLTFALENKQQLL